MNSSKKKRQLKIAHVSCFTAAEPSLAEYSARFGEVLNELSADDVGRLDLSRWEYRTGKEVLSDVLVAFQNFVGSQGPFDCYHFELINHHLMVWAAVLAKSKLKVPGEVVITVHDSPLPVNGSCSLWLKENWINYKLSRLADLIAPKLVFRGMASYVDKAVFLTQIGERCFRESFKHEDIDTIPVNHVSFVRLDEDGGVDGLEASINRPQDSLQLFCAGMWSGGKGLEELLKSVEILKLEGNAVHLILSGDGAGHYAQRIKRRVSMLREVGVRIDLPGYISIADMYRLGRAADFWIVPYKNKKKVSASGVLMRALASGAHIIAADVPQFRELLLEGQSALFYKTETPSSLVTVLSKGMASQSTGKKILDTRDTLAHCAPKNVAKQLDGFY